MARTVPGVRMTLAVLALVTLTACTEIIRNHGYTPSEEDLATLSVGKDTRETVAFKVGRPTAGGVMQDGAWYYVQSRWSHRGARAPQEVQRQVLAISFDSKGALSNIERFGLENGQVVAISRRVTETGVGSSGFVQQMLGNLGRFNPGTFID